MPENGPSKPDNHVSDFELGLYLDGMMRPRQKERLEERLRTDTALAARLAVLSLEDPSDIPENPDDQTLLLFMTGQLRRATMAAFQARNNEDLAFAARVLLLDADSIEGRIRIEHRDRTM